MTFRCSNGIRQGGQLSPLLYNVYIDDLNLSPPSNRCRVLCGRCLGEFTELCALWRHSYQNFVRNRTVSYNDVFKRRIFECERMNVSVESPDTPARVWHFAMNATNHINVVFRKSAYRLISRVTVSPNSIVTAIINSDALIALIYQQSPLMDKFKSMLYV